MAYLSIRTQGRGCIVHLQMADYERVCMCVNLKLFYYKTLNVKVTDIVQMEFLEQPASQIL